VKKSTQDFTVYDKEIALKNKLEKKEIKTTNVNILLNRVKLDQKKIFKKRLIICTLIVFTVSLMGFLAII
tara:strand:+ start:111 stop:320 length:210 start_codon:yes stop_codon:yes gene_type:complete